MTDQGRKSHVVVVGASMAGLRAAEQLRSVGWVGEITVIGEESHVPYNRPPLSKEVLSSAGSLEETMGTVQLRQRSAASTVTFRLGERVVASDLEAKRLTLASGDSLPYDGLVVATGLRPRRLNVPGPSEGRYVVRTLDDAVKLRQELVAQPKVLVIGCGFIGCEVAATASSLGCDVTLVEGSKGPMHRALGATVSAAMRDWLLARGLSMRTDSRVAEFLSVGGRDGENQAAGVRLTDGTTIEASVIVEAIGSIPNVEWLDGNQLDLRDGVLVDDRLRVIGAKGVVAAGDVARYPDPWSGGAVRRVEHWQSAIDTAKTAARTLNSLLADTELPPPYSSVPSFWSDVFGTRVQGLGTPHRGTHSVVLEGTLEAPAEGLVVAYERNGALVGVVTVGIPPARTLQFREKLGQPIEVLQPVAPSGS